MTTLLHIEAGAHLSEESVSRRLTARFAASWPDRVVRRDLAANPVAPIKSAYCALGRRAERCGLRFAEVATELRTDGERREWTRTTELVDELRRTDVLLLGSPMYNLGVPAALKAWIDRVTFPGAFLEADGRSWLRRLDVVIVSPRGGAYGPGSPYEHADFVGPYLRAWLTRYGAADERIHVVDVDHTLAPSMPAQSERRPAAARSLSAAEARLDELAKRLTGPLADEADTRLRPRSDHDTPSSMV